MSGPKAWLVTDAEESEFRRRLGARDATPLERLMAVSAAEEQAEMRAEAARAEQAQAQRGEQMMRMLHESGCSSFGELSALRSQQAARAERIADREDAERAEQHRDAAEAQRAAWWAAGHRPRTLADVLAGAAMFP